MLIGKLNRALNLLKDAMAWAVTPVRIPGATVPSSRGPKDTFEPVLPLHPANAENLSEATLKQIYGQIRAHAEVLAGGPEDIPQRAGYLHDLYLDSGGNHAFPMVALHGALEAKTYFDSAEWLNKHLLAAVLDENHIRDFARRMQETNRQVFIDTYTNYHFSKRFGMQPQAVGVIRDATFLERLNGMHHVAREGGSLSNEAKRALFESALKVEQERTVSAMVEEAAKRFDYDFLESIALRPSLRFAYFPRGESLRFHDFKNMDERIAAALKAYDLAAEVGWEAVERSIQDYGVLTAA